jgi:hypothetical protein
VNIEFIFIGLMITLVAFALYKLVNPIHIAVRKHLFRQQRIWVEGRQYNFQDDFYTIMKVSPCGKLIAFRFPSLDIGALQLNEDGTGNYWGRIHWVRA